MSCDKYREMISARLDGELQKDENMILDRHLQSCPGCSRFAEELGAINQLSISVETIKMPTNIEQNLLNKTVRSSGRRKSLFSYLSGYYRIPRGFAWAGMLLIFLSAANLVIRYTEFSSRKPRVQMEFINAQPAVQKIIISDDDMVSAGGVSRQFKDI